MTSVGVDDAPRWAPDPAGRNAQRYWDGARWTEYVAGPVGGAPTVDPLPDGAAFASPTRPAASPAADLTPTGGEADPPAASGDGRDSTSEPAARPAGWERDPTGRHAQRYWDGTGWTEHVAGPGGGAPISDPVGADLLRATDPHDAAVDPSETGADQPAATVAPDPSPARWSADPSGRSPQRYWYGAAWTPFVAGEDGGIATVDARPVEAWPAPPQPGPEASTVGGAAGAAAPPRSRRRKLAAALAVLTVLAAAAGAALLAGGAGGGGSPTRNTAHRRPASTGAKTGVVGAKVAGTSVTAAPSPAKAAPVDASKDPCALLTQAEIASATGFSVYPGAAIAGGGCAWRGATPFVGESNAHDRETLGGQEGAILAVQPKGTRHPSVICTASIPGITSPAGVCTFSTDATHRYAMFEAGNVVIEIAVHTAHPVTDTGLEQLARAAHQRTG